MVGVIETMDLLTIFFNVNKNISNLLEESFPLPNIQENVLEWTSQTICYDNYPNCHILIHAALAYCNKNKGKYTSTQSLTILTVIHNSPNVVYTITVALVIVGYTIICPWCNLYQ